LASAHRSSVLHLSAAEGGGVDRYIRDLAQNAPRRHFVWHAGPSIDVIEDIAARCFLPLASIAEEPAAAPALADWQWANAVGAIHLHSLDARCRERLALLESVRATPWIVTLHDLTFVDPNAFAARRLEADAGWLAEVSSTLTHAATVIAPSTYIRTLALSHFPDLHTEVIAPGIDAPRTAPSANAPAQFAARRFEHVVAVVGAIGPHKGSALLDALVDRLQGTSIGIVVIGYTDSQLLRGWRVPGRCYVHGSYLEAELPALIAAYGVEVALFPNRLPESFSYTLSEVWSAGIPVIVPDDGALGERVLRHEGGWTLPAYFSAEDARALLLRLFGPEGETERARVKSRIDPRDAGRIPTLAAMARDIDALYQRFGLAPPASGDAPPAGHTALQPLLAANLDGFAFRKELLKLADEAGQLRAALEGATPWAAELERELLDARAWTRKLEHDVEVLVAEVTARVEENRRLADEKAAFYQLPKLVRRLLLRKEFRGRR
jgi:glycosyltransferase involved in cell wall biosynthesis